MKLGNHIQELRKKEGLSQEQLGEKLGVTRQTISNWELGETSPNPEQLKQLSQIFHISVDELIDNDVKSVLEEKVSNTEKLAGIIIKLLKGMGVLFLIFIILDILAFILFAVIKKEPIMEKSESVELFCSLKDKDYMIEVRADGYFNCSNCSNQLEQLKENLIDFDNISKTADDIEMYFQNHGGTCE